MSVLVANRRVSKAEYVNTAIALYKQTIHFLSRMSARYARLMAADVAHLASQIVTHSEAANSIYVNDEVKRQLREKHLVEAKAALRALDVQVKLCYELMLDNPQGCYTNGKGDTLAPKEAEQRLNKTAEQLAALINKENDLLTGIISKTKAPK